MMLDLHADLSDRIRAEGISLKDYREGEHSTTCPECSHTRRKKTDPCLGVKIDHDGGAVWKCHHCGWTGNVPGRAHQCDLELPPRRAKVYQRPSQDHKGAKEQSLYDWFQRRGISPATVDASGVVTRQVWMPGDERGTTSKAICFPYWRGADLINVKYRTVDKRFRQEKDAEKIYYGMNDLDGFETAIVVEGEMDKLACLEAGVRNVISVPDGAPQVLRDDTPAPDDDNKFSYVHHCAEDLLHIKQWVIAVDNDAPGRVLAEELARRYGKENCWQVSWPEMGDAPCKDANDVLIAHGPEALKDALANAEPFPVVGMFKLDAESLIAMRNTPLDHGLSTGWQHIDKIYRVAPGMLTILTGIPGHGKSEWLDALLINLSEAHGWRFAMCSMENPLNEHGGKLVEKRASQPFRSFGVNMFRMDDAAVRTATTWVNDHFTFIRDEGDEAKGLDWVLERAKLAVVRDGVRGLVIDPYNELEHDRQAHQTETEYVGKFLMRLKRFAMRHGIHIWLVAHPAKMYADKNKPLMAPGLYDISGSANWANKADIGITVHRPDTAKPEVEVHVRKVKFRRVGQVGVELLRWSNSTGRYDRAFAEEML